MIVWLSSPRLAWRIVHLSSDCRCLPACLLVPPLPQATAYMGLFVVQHDMRSLLYRKVGARLCCATLCCAIPCCELLCLSSSYVVSVWRHEAIRAWMLAPPPPLPPNVAALAVSEGFMPLPACLQVVDWQAAGNRALLVQHVRSLLPADMRD